MGGWILVILFTLGGEHRSREVFTEERSCMRQAALVMRGGSQTYDTNTSVKLAYCAPARPRKPS